MKLLLDANISRRLAAKLQLHFSDCIHVDQIRAEPVLTDAEIWTHASDNSFVIVTNDEDFLNLVSLKGFPPKVVLLRTGNQSNDYILKVLMDHKTDIEHLITSQDIGLLEIY